MAKIKPYGSLTLRAGAYVVHWRDAHNTHMGTITTRIMTARTVADELTDKGYKNVVIHLIVENIGGVVKKLLLT